MILTLAMFVFMFFVAVLVFVLVFVGVDVVVVVMMVRVVGVIGTSVPSWAPVVMLNVTAYEKIENIALKKEKADLWPISKFRQ